MKTRTKKKKRMSVEKRTAIEKAKDAFHRRLGEMGFSKYADYLKSDHWSRVRKEYAASLLPQFCANCGGDQYHLHHKTYARIGRELLMDFIPLCARCHALVHKKSKAENVGLEHPHIAIKLIGEIKKEQAIANARACTLVDDRWVPDRLSDLFVMERKLGLNAARLQHKRLVGGDYPNLFLFREPDARKYCVALRAGKNCRCEWKPRSGRAVLAARVVQAPPPAEIRVYPWRPEMTPGRRYRNKRYMTEACLTEMTYGPFRSSASYVWWTGFDETITDADDFAPELERLWIPITAKNYREWCQEWEEV